MAITYNLPIKQWYFDTTSQWTLDYPPLFAAFQFLWAFVAHLSGHQDALKLTNSSIRTESVIMFQKVTVILSDIVYYIAVYKICNSLEFLVQRISSTKKKTDDDDKKDPSVNLAGGQNLLDALYRPNVTSYIGLLLLFQPGLLLIDHIHFQYNGFLNGILILSIVSILKGNHEYGSLWFALLLNLKHIYLYFAPAFGMYLLTSYCLAKVKDRSRFVGFITKTLRLGSLVVTVFFITYLPYADLPTLTQILERLFPFKRGLTHAYWAPNIWSLYNTADKVLGLVFKNSLKVEFNLNTISSTKRLSSTSGLVSEYEHQYLPSVRPMTTFILVGVFTIPLILKFLINIDRRSPDLFLKGVTIAAFTSFMFGWHVHEKAIIMVLIPIIPLSLINFNLRNTFLRLTLLGTYSLFPLIYEPAEYLTKLTILIAYYSFAQSLNSLPHKDKGSQQHQLGIFKSIWYSLYNLLDKSFVIFVILIEVYITLIYGRLNYSWNPLVSLNKFEFLPLMLNSSFCAFGITLSYFELYYELVVRPVEDVAAPV